MVGKNDKYFLALYDKEDQCLGVFENYKELVQSPAFSGIALNSLWVRCSCYVKENKPDITRTFEGWGYLCSQKIYETSRKGYSVYKFWEEE